MVLIVNGERIDDSVIKDEYERLRPHYERVFSKQSPQERNRQLMEWSKENVKERTLLEQQARELDFEVDAEEIERALQEAKKRLRERRKGDKISEGSDDWELKKKIEMQIKLQRLVEDVCETLPEPSGVDIENYYDEKKDEFQSPEAIRVSHIVKHIDWQSDEKAAKEAINKAYDELQKGGVFELLVEKYSDCPENNGDLGYFSRGQMADEFEDVVFKLDRGQVSPVFRTRFGFHIAKLYDRRPAQVMPLEAVREKIVSALKEQRRTKAIEDYIDKLKSTAEIKEL